VSAEVKLKDVTAKNWRDVARLELAPDQRDLVAGNLYSIAESKFDPDARPRAVYAGDEPVGFLMYDASDQEALIYRLMIDRRHQRKGYGRAALVLAINEIKALPNIGKISISHMPNNKIVKALCASLGFKEAGLDGDGEMMAELAL
jgi:diamine N-acetyltransferase